MATKRPSIVVLDGFTLNPGDLSWSKLKSLGHTQIYDFSPAETIIERSEHATIILTNKAIIDEKVLQSLPHLECICVTATGFNNVAIDQAAARKIPVCNVVGYGSNSVAQHVFSMILAWTNKIESHYQTVIDGQWSKSNHFSYTISTIQELAGKTIGIYGLGKIGQKVADIALGFGMQVIANHKHPERDQREGIRFVDLQTLFAESDFITLHAPLSKENAHIVNRESLSWMKPNALLINTGRGGLINETDLLAALKSNQIGGAALDVLDVEPPSATHPLIGLPNCIITPHMAWASKEARQLLLDTTIENIMAFLSGKPINVVNGV